MLDSTGTRPPKHLKPHSDITESMITAIIKRLESGKPVRRVLPSGGYLHLDRQVPFLLVYRRASDSANDATEKLLKGEAAYLVLDNTRRLKKGTSALIAALGKSLYESFGAFLLIEIWPDTSQAIAEIKPDYRPAFRLLASKTELNTSWLLHLRKALAQIKIQRTEAEILVEESARPWAPALPRLLPAALAKEINCHYLGIGVRPVYLDPHTLEIFPIIQRNLHRGLGRALRRAIFRFMRDYTTHRPEHFHALGPRSLVKLVWKVDRELAEITGDFDFLLSVTPINAEQAWREFKRSHFQVEPRFVYRPLPIDPYMVKRQLYRIPIEKIEDPALESLFRAQRLEQERKLTMLSDRGTRRFLYGSLQLYGPVDDELRASAQHILDIIPPKEKRRGKQRKLSVAEFEAIAKSEIEYYRDRDPRVWSQVKVRDDIIGIMVSHGNLLVNRNMEFDETRVEALLAHEVGTHILTFFNGQAQPFKQLYAGLPEYEELQEGIAVFSEYLAGGLSGSRLRLLAARVMAGDMISRGATFVEVFQTLVSSYGFARKTAFNVTMRIFRGGGLLKDIIYLRGLIRVLDYLGRGGDYATLLLGKFGADHIHIIRELQWRKVLTEAPLKPRYLERPEAKERLAAAAKGCSLSDMIEGR